MSPVPLLVPGQASDDADATEAETQCPRLLFYRRVSLRTTGACLFFILLVVVVIASFTRGLWIPAIARSLVCSAAAGQSDAILVENFDPNYLVFEEAATLQQAGFSARVLVPVEVSRDDPHDASTVDRGIAELMARTARVRSP